jgi:hypothetical protein
MLMKMNCHDNHGNVLKMAIIHMTVIDTWVKWTKLTAQQTLSLSADRPRNG